jgi:hypothetical protein
MFGLSILLSSFAGEPIATRPLSADLPHIEQAMGVLDVMGEFSVARNVATFVRELLDVLINAKSRQSDQASGLELNFAELDPSMSLALGEVSETGAFSFDFNNPFKTFNFPDDPFQGAL